MSMRMKAATVSGICLAALLIGRTLADLRVTVGHCSNWACAGVVPGYYDSDNSPCNFCQIGGGTVPRCNGEGTLCIENTDAVNRCDGTDAFTGAPCYAVYDYCDA
jgi:hypothetical protein